MLLSSFAIIITKQLTVNIVSHNTSALL